MDINLVRHAIQRQSFQFKTFAGREKLHGEKLCYWSPSQLAQSDAPLRNICY